LGINSRGSSALGGRGDSWSCQVTESLGVSEGVGGARLIETKVHKKCLGVESAKTKTNTEVEPFCKNGLAPNEITCWATKERTWRETMLRGGRKEYNT